MASALTDSPHQPTTTNGVTSMAGSEDPFVNGSNERPSHPYPHRYSAFDNQIFTLNASSSPAQAKRAIEAHIAETNRRLEDAGKLGSSLVRQRAELAEKLKEVEKRKDDAELPAELKEKLAEIERDYDDVGRETARALLPPRSRIVSGDDTIGESSPAILSSQANASPSKVSIPSRKQRNQPTSRAGDIQFAADISTSLLVQVRQLQAALAERDESLKVIGLEKSRLETEAEGFSQRLRAMDESEQRYKDENWSLETQTHEMIAAARDAAEREKKLNVSLAAALADKTKVQNDLDEVRVAHGKLTEDHSAARKIHDSELHTLRRNLDAVDVERDSFQKKIDDLTSQNQELARAITSRSRVQEENAERDLSFHDEGELQVATTPEHSPPPSPTKATPRHGALESETLKSSLHHAHRMIQNLKGNIHREKTEKIELKRMLQDARDELEQRRSESGAVGSGTKRQKTKPELFKKPARPDMLGGNRRPHTAIELDEHGWEDHTDDASPSRAAAARSSESRPQLATRDTTDLSDAYLTASEKDTPFKTASERETTESEDFETGAESLAGQSTDDSTETETEGRVDRKGTFRASKPSVLGNAAGNRSSYVSTASTSASEDEVGLQTPVQPQPLRYRLKMGRGANVRKSHVDATQRASLASSRGSPASPSSSPPVAEQSLFAELADFSGGGSDFSTPGRASIFSSRSTPSVTMLSGRKSLTDSGPAPRGGPTRMVDSAMMTEPWEPETSSTNRSAPAIDAGATAGYNLRGHELPPSPSEFPLPPSLTSSPTKSEVQYTPSRAIQNSPNRGLSNFITPPKTIWDEAQDQEATGSREQNIPSSPLVPDFDLPHVSTQKPDIVHPPSSQPAVPLRAQFSFSPIVTQEIIPVEPPASEMPSPVASSPTSDEPNTKQKAAVGPSGISIIDSISAALGVGKAEQSETTVAEDETNQAQRDSKLENSPDQSLPFRKTSGDAGAQRNKPREKSFGVPAPAPVSNQGSQTLLTAEQIDTAMTPQDQKYLSNSAQAFGAARPPSLRPIITGVTPRSTSRSRAPVPDFDLPSSTSPVRRGASSNSQPSMDVLQHPPLPADHRNVIAKAGGRLPSNDPESSHTATTTGAGMMGPPAVPASAYRRPRNSADQSIHSPTKGGTTPRADRMRTGSQMSRRSSVSSFASELDQRFNIRTDGLPANHSFEAGPGTDPRMIQAITQTMIGEFLWKYTRKPGRPEMSNTRHRRYFWVHPYTKTLYWSEQDPQAAGVRELKAKSVAIESVRVVSDDNPMPPGLHRKSLEVVTPGRKVKFTAGTGNRHETWFNALSYLLMRGQEDGGATTWDGGLTADDVNEFNPGAYRTNSRMNRTSKLSLSSYNSQTTRGTNHARASVRQGYAPSTTTTTNALSATASGKRAAAASSSSTNQATANGSRDPNEANRTIRQGSISRLSNIFKPSSIRDSFSMSRRSFRQSDMGSTVISTPSRQTGRGGESIYNASVVSDGAADSAEELKRDMLRRERDGEGRLENVRACCDGKHDVSDLVSGGRHRHGQSTTRRHRSRDRLAASLSSRPR